jgi:hypothetical protein
MLAYNTITNEVSYFSSVMMPYLYGFANLASASSFGINFTNGASLNHNVYFTLRCQVAYTYNDPLTIGLNPYYTNYQFLMDVWPNRVPTVSSSGVCLPSGVLNGNGAYVLTDPTYAPSGRWYWIRNYSNSTLPSATAVTDPFSFTSSAQSSVTFVLNAPSTGTVNYSIEATVEVVNRSTGTTLTSSNVSTCFAAGSSYASF